MKKLLLASALALGSYAGAAQAAPTITSPATLNLINFGTGNGGGLQTGATAAATAAGITFSGNAGVFSGSSAGTTSANGYTSPFGSANTNYLAIEPGGSISFTFATAQTTFGLLFGTIDSYNNFSFTASGAGGTQTFSGTDVANALGVSANGGTTRNVLFSGLNPFTRVTLSDTTSSAFEFVPASSVPEPAAWGMMITGFGLVGGVLRRRQSVKIRFA